MLTLHKVDNVYTNFLLSLLFMELVGMYRYGVYYIAAATNKDYCDKTVIIW